MTLHTLFYDCLAVLVMLGLVVLVVLAELVTRALWRRLARR